MGHKIFLKFSKINIAKSVFTNLHKLQIKDFLNFNIQSETASVEKFYNKIQSDEKQRNNKDLSRTDSVMF